MTEIDGEEASSVRVSSSTQPTKTQESTISKDFRQAGDTSEGDNEGPVREKLKKTSINALPKHGLVASTDLDDDDVEVDGETEGSRPRVGAAESPHKLPTEPENEQDDTELSNGIELRGRPLQIKKKRSFDDLNEEDQGITTTEGPNTEVLPSQETHVRKRSKSLRSADRREAKKKRDSLQVSSRDPDHDKSMSDDGITEHEDENTRKTPDQDDVMDHSREQLVSPKKKRSHEQLEQDDAAEGVARIAAEEEEQRKSLEMETDRVVQSSRATREKPEAKRHRDISQDDHDREAKQAAKTTIPLSSGFANASAVSPFGTLASTKAPGSAGSGTFGASTQTSQTSTSAFAASGFGALSASTASPFAPVSPPPGKPSFTPLGSDTKPLSPSTVGFGSGTFASGPATFSSGTTAIASPFVTASSGFGSLGGGFGGSFGGGLKGFGSGGSTGIIGLSEKPPVPFGAPANEDDESASSGGEESETAGEGGEGTSGKDLKEPKPDKRFRPQEVETGEDGETTSFSCRAKLFQMVEIDDPSPNSKENTKAWKERGTGILKLNIPDEVINVGYESDPDTPSEEEEAAKEDEARTEKPRKKPRLLMRSDGVMRVILNAPIFKGMEISAKNEYKQFIFSVFDGGKMVLTSIRISNAAYGREFYERIQEIKASL